MKELFEKSNTLNLPIETFMFITEKEPFPVEAHWHYFMEILYCKEGTIFVACKNKTYEIKEGEMVIIKPREVHSIFCEKGEHAIFLGLKFDASKISMEGTYIPSFQAIFTAADKFVETGKSLKAVFNETDFHEFTPKLLFEDCIHEMDEKKYGYDAYLRCRIAILSVEILRIWREEGFCPEGVSYSTTEEYSIHTILEYIDRHSNENISIEELAAKCHMSYSYFSRSFKYFYGQTCKQYIEFIRLSKAENFLLFTNYDLNFISTETGFSDCSHLIRVFRKKYGMTPRRYRVKYKRN